MMFDATGESVKLKKKMQFQLNFFFQQKYK